MSKNLFEESDDNLDEDNFGIKTNENYAKSYNSLRKKELLQKYKGLNESDSDSNDSDSSEEDEVLNPSFDQDFLKTLASLKCKDPAIYDRNTKFFKNESSEENSEDEGNTSNSKIKEKKSKPVTLKDYERNIILEQGGKFVDDSDDDNDQALAGQRPLSPTIAEEELNLKAEFKKVMYDENDSDEEFGGIFKKREKTNAEKDREEEDYLKWMAGKNENIEERVKEKLEPLKSYWSNDKLPSSEKFLRDYVLNKGYTEANNYEEIPTYEEIVGDPTQLSEDEQELQKQAEFEQKYNFRYEEPDQEFIKRYPRTIESSLRLTDEKRKQKRHEVKERKLQEKQQQLKELEMVKELKRKEIQEKIEKLKMVTGNEELGFKDDDLEEDFDSDAHDRRMQELFNDDYYQVDEGEEKPECPSDIEELKVEDWDNYDPKHYEDCYDGNEAHCEDEDFNMDCDYDPKKGKDELQKELIENTRKKRGGRKGRRDRFMEIIKADKPVFDPEDERTYGEYIDEYYNLDCEDIIGDTPCRFKYVETTPNDFGLSIEEILLAKNKELNQWASLKKTIQIRPDNVEKKEKRLYKLKSKNEELKRKIFKSIYGDGSDNENEELDTEKAKIEQTTGTDNHNANSSSEVTKKSKKKKKRKSQNVSTEPKISPSKELDIQNNSANEPTTSKKNKNNKVVHIDDSSDINKASKNRLEKYKANHENKNKNQMQNTTKKENGKKGTASNLKNSKNAPNKDNQNQISGVLSKETLTVNKNAQKISYSSTQSKSTIKNNPFAKVHSQSNNFLKGSIGALPPLRNTLPKAKKLNSKSIAKFKGKNSFKGKSKTSLNGDSTSINDERLKAYGINPKKFHKKQKYGNVNQNLISQ